MPIPSLAHRAARAAIFFATLASAGCVTAPPEGASPAHPQRPTFSSDTATVDEGVVEVEAGLAIDPGDSLDTPVQFKYGLGPRTELFAGGSPYVVVERPGDDGSGFGDGTVGLRHRLRDAGPDAPALGVQLTTKLPTASTGEGIGSGQVDWFGALMASERVAGYDLTAFYELGVVGEGDEPETDLQHGFALAASASYYPRVSAFGELALVLVPEQDNEAGLATFGLAFEVQPWLVLDVGCVAGLTSDAPDFRLVFGLTQTLGELFTGATGVRRGR